MKIYAYFDKYNLSTLIGALQELDSCNVITIGSSERKQNSDTLLYNAGQVTNFINENTEGFFLHSNEGLYDVSLQKDSFSTICFFPKVALKEEILLEIIKAYISADSAFGYAAECEEHEYRNRIRIEVAGSEIESWVGRNLSKYLPGLYYLTFISKKQAEEKSIEIESLKINSISYIDMPNQAVLFKFYENSTLWTKNKEKIDQICRSERGVFCKDEVEQCASKAENVMDFIMKTREWN